jgi:hypothetical protein
VVTDPRLDAALGSSPVDARDGTLLTSDAFARLALIASGTADSQIEPLFARMKSLAEALRSTVPSDADERTKAEAILTLLYNHTLKRYSEFQTRVDTALLSGDYNCVSSAVLFYYLARTADLKVGGVETPNHAFCTVEINGVSIDVETTNPYGFDPGSQRELSAAQSAEKTYVIVPKTKYLNRKPVDERRLLSLIYGNRISLLQKKGGFEETIGLTVDERTLQGPSFTMKDLAEPFLTYAASLSSSGKRTEGLQFIKKVRELYGDYGRYHEYITATVSQTLNDLMRKNDYQGSYDLLSAWVSDIDPATYAEMYRGLTFNSLQSMSSTLTLREYLAKVNAARAYLDAGDYEKLVSYAYYLEADRIRQSDGWLKAVAVLDQGLKDLPGQKDLTAQKKAYLQNYAIEVHNKAVSAYNTGNTAELKAILSEGLQAVPDNTLLKNDLKMIK